MRCCWDCRVSIWLVVRTLRAPLGNKSDRAAGNWPHTGAEGPRSQTRPPRGTWTTYSATSRSPSRCLSQMRRSLRSSRSHTSYWSRRLLSPVVKDRQPSFTCTLVTFCFDNELSETEAETPWALTTKRMIVESFDRNASLSDSCTGERI